MGINIMVHATIAIICWYLAYCAKHDLPYLKIKPIANFFIGLYLGWIGLIIVVVIIFYKICRHHTHTKGE